MADSPSSWLRHSWDSLWLNLRLSPVKYIIEHEMMLPKLRGVQLRQYAEEDFEACRLLHDNENRQFPKESILHHIYFLRNRPETNLVAELNGKIIGCASYLLIDPNYSVLVSEWVHRDYRRMGVGRLLLFGWFAQMPLISGDTSLQVFPTKQTWNYYLQYDFKKSSIPWKDPAGKQHEFAALGINSHIIKAAQRYLRLAKVPFPDLSHLPPLRPYLADGPTPKETAKVEDSSVPAYEH